MTIVNTITGSDVATGSAMADADGRLQVMLAAVATIYN
jgi:hypothetical protein